MIAETVTAVDPSQYTVQYELLRSQLIAARCEAACPAALCGPRGVGLALLLREGMPGWLKALETVIRASAAASTAQAAGSARAPDEDRNARAPAWLTGVPRHDLTTLLTSLVLSTRPIERCSPREGHQSCH